MDDRKNLPEHEALTWCNCATTLEPKSKFTEKKLLYLLWGTLPLSDAPHPWVLLALPVTCGVLSGLCWWLARTQRLQPLLKDIQAQIALDLQAIRQVHSA